MFVFVGAPYVERLRGSHALSAALTGMLAAVVGVIANLASFFSIHTLFADVATRTFGPVQLQVPELSSLKPLSLAIALLAAILLFRLRWSVLRTLGVIAVMIAVAPVQTALAGVVFLPALWLVSSLARRPVRRLGHEVEATLASSLRSATETLALASDIRLAGRSADFSARFGSVRTRLARAAGT